MSFAELSPVSPVPRCLIRHLRRDLVRWGMVVAFAPACGGGGALVNDSPSSSTGASTPPNASGDSIPSGSSGASGGGNAGGTSGLVGDASTVSPAVDASVPGADVEAPANPLDASMLDGQGSANNGLDAASLSGAGAARGLASYNGCTDLSLLNTSWYYNWTAATKCESAAEFIPQIWGHAGENIGGEITAAKAAGYGAILGFNEPDNTTQSNIAVTSALALWPQLTQNPAFRLGSPATQANTTGQAWMTAFMKAVNADTTGKLRVDFIAIHWYGWNAGSCDASASTLESYVRWAEAIPGNRPIWLTEWACSNLSDPSAPVVQAFLRGALAMFARHPRIERYGWFTSRSNDNNGLVTSGGMLTPLGQIYANVASTN